nr:hypothetical protein [uncultured Pedobacter sp.]
MFGLEPVNLFAFPLLTDEHQQSAKVLQKTLLNHCRSHGLDCVQKIYRGGMNKDSEALILWLLSHQGESD